MMLFNIEKVFKIRVAMQEMREVSLWPCSRNRYTLGTVAVRSEGRSSQLSNSCSCCWGVRARVCGECEIELSAVADGMVTRARE
jgi:hypothetical protein